MTPISTQGLSGKTAFVTGASRGIGRAIALGYAQAGADVAVLARSEPALKVLAEVVEGMGRRCVVLPVDVTDRREAESAVESVIREFGHLDILVNNAGVVGAYNPFLDLTLEDWELTLATKPAGRHRLHTTGRRAHGGAGHGVRRRHRVDVRRDRRADAEHYAVTKAAMASLTKTLGAEWAASGVRVNAVAPGWVDTKMTAAVVDDPQISDGLLHAVPGHRWGDCKDVVGPAIFLASDAARSVTGATLVVDGGLINYGGGPHDAGPPSRWPRPGVDEALARSVESHCVRERLVGEPWWRWRFAREVRPTATGRIAALRRQLRL